MILNHSRSGTCRITHTCDFQSSGRHGRDGDLLPAPRQTGASPPPRLCAGPQWPLGEQLLLLCQHLSNPHWPHGEQLLLLCQHCPVLSGHLVSNSCYYANTCPALNGHLVSNSCYYANTCPALSGRLVSNSCYYTNTCRVPYLGMGDQHFTMATVALFSASKQTHHTYLSWRKQHCQL